MIDFIKILLHYSVLNGLLDNPLLEFKGKYNRATGEIQNFPLIAEYHNLKFIIKSDRTILLTGSLHKYWNSINGRGQHNYNDFSFPDLVSVILDIKEKFNIDLSSTHIQNIEIGVNIITPYYPDRFLKSLINHKGQSFNKEQGTKKHYLQCEKQQYIIKVYNKGLQYNQLENILRFEGKITKMAKLKKAKIKTLSDLLDINKIIHLGAILKSYYNDLLLYDNSINTVNLNDSERAILEYGSNPNNWDTLKENSENNFYKKRNRFNEILNKCDGNLLKEMTGILITEKWSELSKVDEETLRKLTNFQNEETLQKLTDFKNKEITEINHSSIGLISSPSSSANIERRCLICGKDISDKKKVAKYCSTKCKNDYTNPILSHRNNLLKRIKNIERNPSLFNTVEYLSSAERQILEHPNSIFKNYTT